MQRDIAAGGTHDSIRSRIHFENTRNDARRISLLHPLQTLIVSGYAVTSCHPSCAIWLHALSTSSLRGGAALQQLPEPVLITRTLYCAPIHPTFFLSTESPVNQLTAFADAWRPVTALATVHAVVRHTSNYGKARQYPARAAITIATTKK